MLENYSYCPILHTRIAEIKALHQLPATTKDRIFPFIVARPWPNAKKFDAVWDKIDDALGGRRFALDLDADGFKPGSEKSAMQEFNLLFNPKSGFGAYYDLIEQHSFAIPVLRLEGFNAASLAAQLEHVERLDRGLFCRLHYQSGARALEIVDQVLQSFVDVVFVIDTEWARDLLSRENWASQVVQRISASRPEAEIIIAGSSFPDIFTHAGIRTLRDLHERVLFANLVRRHNAATLYYGDWASTRPTRESTPMKTVPRIDLPIRNGWIHFRQDKDADESYMEIATRVLADNDWPDDLQLWGTYAIQCTAEDSPGGIRGQSSAAAVRINIHMHQQAFYGAEEVISDFDEPYTD